MTQAVASNMYASNDEWAWVISAEGDLRTTHTHTHTHTHTLCAAPRVTIRNPQVPSTGAYRFGIFWRRSSLHTWQLPVHSVLDDSKQI